MDGAGSRVDSNRLNMSQTLLDAPLPTADADCVHNTSVLRRDQEHAAAQADFDALQLTCMPAVEAVCLPVGPNEGREATSCREVAGVSGFTDGRSPELVNWEIPIDNIVIHVGDVLGSGAGGIVYRASVGHRSGLAAVKMLHSDDHRRTRRAMADLREEMRIGNEIPLHPNLPQFLGVCRAASENPGVIWEFIDGQNLEQFFELKRKTSESWRPTTQECLSWCQQIFAALACLHGHGLVHRDVKPANVMLANDHSTIKLVDFGLCRRNESIHQDNGAPTSCWTQRRALSGVAGSFRYMAPEIVLEVQDGYGAEVDIYSAAMCAWFIAAGLPPFSNLNGEQVAALAARTNLRPAPCKGLQNCDFWRVIERAWAAEPTRRPDACTIEAQLAALLRDEVCYQRTRARSPLTRLYESARRKLRRHVIKSVSNWHSSTCPDSESGSEAAADHTSTSKMGTSLSSSRSSSPLPSLTALFSRATSK